MSNQNDIFTQINHAVLDLQAAKLQTYERPLKTLVRLLNHSILADMNRDLTSGADLDKFLAESELTGRGTFGNHRLAWPEDSEQCFGLTLKLLEKLAADQSFTINFSHTYFTVGSKIEPSIHALTSQLIIPFVRDYKAYVMNHGTVEPKLVKPKSDKIFIVHGHDGEARESVARFLQNLDLKPIILHEQANRGRTVIEKVEANSDVGFAVVLLTPDDLGKAKDAPDYESRVRQNVLLELGYFIGYLKRENVCAIKKGTVEIPSDFAGVIWETMDAANGWKQALGRELEAAGYVIDWNKVMRA